MLIIYMYDNRHDCTVGIYSTKFLRLSALYVPKNRSTNSKHYSFNVGNTGLCFRNFRILIKLSIGRNIKPKGSRPSNVRYNYYNTPRRHDASSDCIRTLY